MYFIFSSQEGRAKNFPGCAGSGLFCCAASPRHSFSGGVPAVPPGALPPFSGGVPAVSPGALLSFTGGVPVVPPGALLSFSGGVPAVPPGTLLSFSGGVPAVPPGALLSFTGTGSVFFPDRRRFFSGFSFFGRPRFGFEESNTGNHRHFTRNFPGCGYR